MKTRASVPPLVLIDALSSKLLPWAEQSAAERILVAQRSYRDFLAATGKLPEGVTVSRTRLRGRRIVTKGPAASVQSRIVSAHWPEDRLEEKRVPMLVCVLGGQVDWQLGEYTLHSPPGNFIIVPPGVPNPDGDTAHLDGTRRDSDFCDLLWLRPAAGIVHCALCHSQGKRHWKLPEDAVDIQHRQVTNYFEDLVQEAMARKPGHEKVCRSLLVALFSVVLREMQSGNHLPALPHTAPEIASDGDHDPISNARLYMQERFREPLTMEQVARAVYLSRSQFAKRFHAETGRTFTEYLTHLRLEQARLLLRDTDWTVRIIGDYVGWQPTHFLEVFHRHEAISPSAYRRKHRG